MCNLADVTHLVNVPVSGCSLKRAAKELAFNLNLCANVVQ